MDNIKISISLLLIFSFTQSQAMQEEAAISPRRRSRIKPSYDLCKAILNDSEKDVDEAIHANTDYFLQSTGQHPLEFALAHEKSKAVKALSKSKTTHYCCGWAEEPIREGHVRHIYFLFKNRKDEINTDDIRRVIIVGLRKNRHDESVKKYSSKLIQEALTRYPNALDTMWQPALALDYLNKNIVETERLLHANADPNEYCKTITGMYTTPLFEALKLNYALAVIRLLQAGAEATKVGYHHGPTPLTYAKSNNEDGRMDAIIKILTEHQQKIIKNSEVHVNIEPKLNKQR